MITFENDNDVILYALEKIISCARDNQYIFLAQSVWWISGIIGLQQGLVDYIDKLRNGEVTVPQEQVVREVSTTPRDLTEDRRVDKILNDTERYLRDSRRLREIAALKVSGKIITGQINPVKRSKRRLRKSEIIPKSAVDICSKTRGINDSEISRRKAAGECLRCAWPCDRKGGHRVKDCRRQIKLEKGTAPYLKGKSNQRPVVPSEESYLEDSSSSEDSATRDNSVSTNNIE